MLTTSETFAVEKIKDHYLIESRFRVFPYTALLVPYSRQDVSPPLVIKVIRFVLVMYVETHGFGSVLLLIRHNAPGKEIADASLGQGSWHKTTRQNHTPQKLICDSSLESHRLAVIYCPSTNADHSKSICIIANFSTGMSPALTAFSTV